MAEAGITLDMEKALKGEFQTIRDNFPDKAEELMDTGDGIAEIIRGAMVTEAPFKWGDLREGHTVEETGELERYIFSDVPHFEWVVLGTRPHDIYPRAAVTYLGSTVREGSGKSALFWEGADHPVYMVHHPGTAPNDYPSRALQNVDGEIEGRLQRFLDEVFK